MKLKLSAITFLTLIPLVFSVLPQELAKAVVSPTIVVDPGNSSSYSGSGTSVSSVGTTSATGTMSNITYSAVNGGKFTFNGTSSSISFPTYNFTNYFTISAWVRPLQTSNINTVVSNIYANVESNGFKVEWNNWLSNSQKMTTETGNGVTGSVAVTDSAVIAYDSWQMLTWVVNKAAGLTSMYKNGVLQTSTSNSIKTDFNVSGSWWIGSMYGNSYWMKGDLGTLKVWTSNLTASELQAEYDATKARYATALAPTVAAHPGDSSINTGQSASFSATGSTTDAGTLSYQWQVSTNSGSTWTNVSSGTGSTSSNYTTATNTRASNGYLFRAVITNTLNGTTSTTNTNSAQLTVNKLMPTVSMVLPGGNSSIATFRTNYTVTINSSVPGTISVKAGGTWVPGCRSLPISASTTCQFKPSRTGAVTLSAALTPTATDDYFNAVSPTANLLIKKRSGLR